MSSNFLLTCDHYAHFLQLSGKKETAVEAVYVEVITLVVHTSHEGANHSCGVWEVVPDELRFLPIVYTHLVEIAGLAVRQHKGLYSPGIWLAFQVLAETDTAFEGNDGLVNGHPLRWSVRGLKGWNQAIKQRLNFVAFQWLSSHPHVVLRISGRTSFWKIRIKRMVSRL